MKATFGFGENVPWNRIGSDAKERSHAHAQPQSPSTHSRWVTRCNVKVDRIACPWLIRRFVDNAAEFIFVSEDTLLTTAHRLKAIRFDAPSLATVKLNHREKRCTFEAILEDYALDDPVLQRLGLIVRAADIRGEEHAAVEGPGLRAIANGFAALGLSDEDRLAREFPIYDALYEYVRQQSH
jgi:hypothetical protein